MKKLNITKEHFEKSKYFTKKYGKLEYVSESGKLFKTEKGKILKFKESSDDDLYDFYEWLKSNTELDSGIHVKFHENEDGSGSIEMIFTDRYQWADDVEEGNLPKSEDSGIKEWIALFERKAAKNGWELDTDEDEDEFYLILSPSNEYQESTNPRFKCMEETETNDRFVLELRDENDSMSQVEVDITDESDWGNINTDGTCYWTWNDPDDPDEEARMFDGIGYGNDEDGYEMVVGVKNAITGEDVPLNEFARMVEDNVRLFSQA